MERLVRKAGYVFGLALVVLVLITVIRGPQGIHALSEKRKEIRALQEQNADLTREVEAKKVRIQRLNDSRAEQELEIRKRLKLVRPGETSFILPDAPKQ